MRTIVLLGLLSLAGVAQANTEQCKANFTQTGNLFGGRTFTTWFELPAESQPDVFKRYYAQVAKSGLKIVNADRDMGIITSVQTTNGYKGDPTTLDFSTVIEPSGKGSKVTITMKSPPGKAIGRDAVVNSFCSGT